MKLNLQYTESKNALHVLSPVFKLVWALSLTFMAILLEHPVFLFFLLISTMAVAGIGKIWLKWASIMKLTIWLCLMIALINVLVNHNGTHVLWQTGLKIPGLGYFEITLEAVIFSLGMSLRLLTIISVFTIFTLTVHPDDFIQTMLKVKIPSKSVMVISLAARFLPVLIADAERISLVQQSRGLKIDAGNLIQRIKNRAAVLIPLFSNSLDRTAQLAEAMESRAFGSGKPRVYYKPVRINNLDWLGLIFCILAVVTVLIMSFIGWADYQYYPVFDSFRLDLTERRLLSLLIILVLGIIPLALVEKRLQND
jgi:energy-coupling factor transport system permease protein